MTPHRRIVPALLAGALALAGCTTNSPSGDDATGAEGGPLAVDATDSACEVAAAEAPSGNLTFDVTNGGAKVTEFYLLGDDGLRIIGEVENIGPGLTRQLVVRAAPGGYYTVCKPGMVGEGIRHPFTVTDSGADLAPAGEETELVAAANAQYKSYVKDQSEQLAAKTRQFVDLYKAGEDEQARGLYPVARVHWERIETVAESFGDLDPKVDAREADLEPGQKWTGWHVMEKDLWPPKTGYTPLTTAQRATMADQLMTDTTTLVSRTKDLDHTVDQIGNGAKGLLDEVATSKVTGEEEFWSHTDLWDFQANVDGARVAWEGLRPLLQKRDAQLDSTVALRFAELQKLLDSHKSGDGFVLYTELTKPEVKALSDAVNALSEPLSKVTAAVV